MRRLRTPATALEGLPGFPFEPHFADAPFPDDSYKAGSRVFPILVPTFPDDPAWVPGATGRQHVTAPVVADFVGES